MFSEFGNFGGGQIEFDRRLLDAAKDRPFGEPSFHQLNNGIVREGRRLLKLEWRAAFRRWPNNLYRRRARRLRIAGQLGVSAPTARGAALSAAVRAEYVRLVFRIGFSVVGFGGLILKDRIVVVPIVKRAQALLPIHHGKDDSLTHTAPLEINHPVGREIERGRTSVDDGNNGLLFEPGADEFEDGGVG